MDEKLLTIGEAARTAGVSVRTLHHYDQIGLLSPNKMSEGGYRLYGPKELARLEQILFFRELEFSLEDIRSILTDPAYDEREAILKQIALMEKKRERLDALILRLRRAAKGDKAPQFAAFEREEIDRMKNEYAKEVRERWGNTAAYAQSEKKQAGYSQSDYASMEAEMNALMAKFAAMRGADPADAQVQALVEAWKACISKWCYDCTDEILEGLGKMYVCDERFAANIDKHGEGTAQCMSEAIAAYIDAKLA